MGETLTDQEWPWPHFRDVADGGTDHLRCGCCGVLMLDPGFMSKLEHLRMEFGRPMPVTSGYRCRKYDGDLRSLRGQEGTGVHTTGHAVDVHVVGEDAHRLLMLAGKHGMTGVGVSQRGAYESRFIHLDDAWRPEFPRPMVWSY